MNASIEHIGLESLLVWQPADSFAARVREIDQQTGFDLLTDRRLRKLQEALILADFAPAIGFRECRLTPFALEFPDAQVRNSPSTVVDLELTEVLEPGRTRDREYRAIKKTGKRPGVQPVDPQQLGINAERWPDWFLQAVTKKLKYGPSGAYDIVVYNNVFVFDPQITTLSAGIGELLSKKGFFQHSVWHYRANAVYRVWPQVERFEIPDWRRSL